MLSESVSIPDDFPLVGWLHCPVCRQLISDEVPSQAGKVHGITYTEKRERIHCIGILRNAVIADVDKPK